MASIRAYGWTGSYTKECARLLSNCQKPYYLLMCIQKWLAVVLGLIVAGLATVLAALAVTLKGSTVSAGFIGIALVNMMGLSQSLANLIVFWTSLETSLGAVSRIKSFSEDTPREEDGEGEPAVEWPSCGKIVFDNWSAAYGEYVCDDYVDWSQLANEVIVALRFCTGSVRRCNRDKRLPCAGEPAGE